MNLAVIDIFYPEKHWAKLGRASVVAEIQARLDDLARWLGEREYLEDRYTVADLFMTTVLRALRHTDLVAQLPNLEAYRLCCEARPAFRKALTDHLAVFAEHTPPDAVSA